ncbi:MAG: hypothetical protein ACXWL9_10215 [Syntrophales bacterium]
MPCVWYPTLNSPKPPGTFKVTNACVNLMFSDSSSLLARLVEVAVVERGAPHIFSRASKRVVSIRPS